MVINVGEHTVAQSALALQSPLIAKERIADLSVFPASSGVIPPPMVSLAWSEHHRRRGFLSQGTSRWQFGDKGLPSNRVASTVELSGWLRSSCRCHRIFPLAQALCKGRGDSNRQVGLTSDAEETSSDWAWPDSGAYRFLALTQSRRYIT